MAIAAIIVGLLSLGVAVVVAVRQDGLQRRLLAIEEGRRTEEMEHGQRAELTAALERRPQPTLVIRNQGPATARDVKLDQSALVAQGVLRVLGAEALPLAALSAGEECALGLVLHDGTELLISFSLQWRDETGDRERNATVSRL